MAEKIEKKANKAKRAKVEDEKDKKKDKKTKKAKHNIDPSPAVFSLLASDSAVDPTLSSLFAAKSAPAVRTNIEVPEPVLADSDEDDNQEAEEDETPEVEPLSNSKEEPDRKRKRKRDDAAAEEIEDAYMRRLMREEEAGSERKSKRVKDENAQDDSEDPQVEASDDEEAQDGPSEEADDMSPPPQHETQQSATDEVDKANRTVFLGNVSTTAISSKAARKALETHLKSFFDALPKPGAKEPKHVIESLRFRSTPYASAIPKKAAYAKKELMDATTKSTNAYAVYSSALLAREAARRLNGTIVLDRHLRVDEVAHPAKVDNRRCVFVGNLGFVDDESNIQDANEEDGREKRKRGQIPSDVEEGLWRTFGKCGTVESVRVIRDSTTRVSKGIAYVQFEDENGVEAALLLNEKKFPPMLPRKLRVSRAKAPKKNAKPGTGRPVARPSSNGYQRKFTGAESSQLGRAGKLFGKAAAAGAKRPQTSSDGSTIKRPEQFVFEGHRASSKSGTSGLNLGGKRKKSGKPTSRSAKRGAAFKASKKKTPA